MTEASDTKSPRDGQTVSIAGGSLLVIGFMLWFFTSGIKTEVQNLRNEIRELKESLEKQADTLQQPTLRVDAGGTPD